MGINFAVEPRLLGMSECERMCGRPSWEVTDLAQMTGYRSLPGDRLNVSVGTAINMLVLSIAKSNGVEPQAMTAWLPGLRNETLLTLSEDYSNWSFDGASEAENAFWPTLYGGRDAVRPHTARLLQCSAVGAIRQLYYYSQNDVVCLSSNEFDAPSRNTPPRFVIRADDLAEQIRNVCGGPLFHAKAVNFA